jgi:hypothetical protein
VDLSPLIFVALAVAWAAYLVPKALRHHDEDARGRSVERFSEGMRVLARREPVSARRARLVDARPSDRPVSSPSDRGEVPVVEPVETSRRSNGAAAKRRRRVLSVLLLALVATVAAAALHRIMWAYVAIPAALLVGWLVACRLMVRKERSVRRRPSAAPASRRSSTSRRSSEVETSSDETPAESTGKVPLVEADAPQGPAAPGLWDPVPVTLPTYVSKPAARRTVRTIDLDSTGVWTSGRSESDSALAREADAADRARRSSPRQAEAGDEAVGS